MSEDRTDIDLDALEATARAATPGPWATAMSHDRHWNLILANSGTADEARVARTADDDDAHHIAAFDPRTVLALIACLREAEAENRRLRAVMGRGFEKTLEDRDEAYREMHARELHHFEEEKLRAEAEAVIEDALPMLGLFRAWNVTPGQIENLHRILSRYKTTKTEGES